MFVLQAHYRKPIDFTDEALKAASSGWDRLNGALQLGIIFGSRLGWPEPVFEEKLVVQSLDDSKAEQLSKLYGYMKNRL